MNARVTWKDNLHFIGEASGHNVDLDAKRPLGRDAGMSPKEMVAVGLCGCTAMDVASLMKKHRQPLESLEITVDTIVAESHPAVFTEITLNFYFKGQIDKAIAAESVKLSQTKYCAVSAMLSKAAPIHYKVFLNGEEIARGESGPW